MDSNDCFAELKNMFHSKVGCVCFLDDLIDGFKVSV